MNPIKPKYRVYIFVETLGMGILPTMDDSMLAMD